MATRERRVSRPPLKFAQEDEYWEQQAAGSRRANARPTTRQVYRLLKQRDVRKDLAGQEVHVYWPDNQQWYRAEVEEVTIAQPEPSAYLHYPDTDEYEDVDLNEVIEAKQIAVIETRSMYAKLKRDEIPVSAVDRLNAVYEDEDEHSQDEAAAESASEEPEVEPRMSREHHKQVQRPKRARDVPNERAGSAKKVAGNDDGVGHVQQGHAGDSDMAEAEAFKNGLINALMHTFSGPSSAPSTMIPTPTGSLIPTSGSGGHAPMIMIPTPGGGGREPGSARGLGSARGDRPSGLKQHGSLPSAGSTGGDEDVRSKVRQQLVTALQRAADELKAEGYSEALPAASAVATEVEAELYKLHGESVSAEYKAKFRSLSFNLKDNANPELRARVLRGELAPDVLVTLGPAELARKELSAWRQKRQEEAVKAVFLDAETAAKFSTAAAAALAQSRMDRKDEDVPQAKPTTSPDHAPTLVEGGSGGTSAAADDAMAAAVSAAAAAALAGDGEAAHRRPRSLARVDSATTSVSAGGDAAETPASDLARRASVTSVPEGPDVHAGAPSSTGPSPAKRAVLRAALPAAAPGDETPPRADEGPDAPYDPGSYDEPYDPEQQQPDDTDTIPHYDPTGATTAGSKLGGVPSLASLRAGPSATMDRQASIPSPIRSPVAAVMDLAPIMQRPDAPVDNMGDTLWTGLMRVPSSTDVLVAVEVSFLGGLGRLGPMLRCAEPSNELVVKGQVKLSRVEQFFEELRRSRSRTITLALVRELSREAASAVGLGEAAAAAADSGGMAEFVMQHRNRTGLATPLPALEAYLVTRGGLAARLLKTARGICPSHQLAMLPEDIGEDQLLLAMVHPRAWEPPPHALRAAPQHHLHRQHHHHPLHQHHHGQPPGGPGAMPGPGPGPLDLRALPPTAAADLLPSPTGYAPPGLPAGDPRLRGTVGADAQAPPYLQSTAPPATAGDGAGSSTPPIDLGALSDLAAALGIPGGAGSGAGEGAHAPSSTPPGHLLEAPSGAGQTAPSTQLVTVVMQNPDGTLSIVAVPQGSVPPHGMQGLPPGAPPPPTGPPMTGQPGGPVHGMLHGPPLMPGGGAYADEAQFQPPVHSHARSDQGPPGGYPPHGPQELSGPYGEPSTHDPYGARYYDQPPPPGSRGGPGPQSGGGAAPYTDQRGGPPPQHHGYAPQQQHPEPYYGGPPSGHAGPQPQHYGPPQGSVPEGGGPGGPGPDGRPPPYYPPNPHDGSGYDFYRGGPPGPDPYQHGPPERDRGGHAGGRSWNEQGSGGRWGGRHGGGGGRGRGGFEEPRFDSYDRGGGRSYEGGYRGGRGGRDGGRGREWGGGPGRGERREWEGRDRDRDRGYGRHDGYPR